MIANGLNPATLDPVLKGVLCSNARNKPWLRRRSLHNPATTSPSGA
jgi:hypothetical protein